jgi:hypothetical protein
MARKPKQPTPTSWSIYKVAKKVVWLGTVEAPDKQAAIEKGAQEFKTDAWRLCAVARKWPHHVGLSADKVRGVRNSEIVWSFAGGLSAAPRPCRPP